MTHERNVVRSYYEYVDEEAYEDLFSLFADDVVYERPGQPPIEGIAEFREFYLEKRPLSEGDHRIHDVVVDGDTVAVRGSFTGLQDGDRVSLEFADFHVFDDDGTIARRYTFTDRDTV